jgi:hypothetical protein
MNLFAFASQTETQGMVLTEAMAAGVPVIALDAPGAREVISHGANGILLDSDASETNFAGKLIWAVGAPKELTAWSEQAGKTAQAFSRERCAQRLADLYADVTAAVGGKKGRNARDLDPWEKFLQACRAEWTLASEKAESVIQMTSDEEELVGLNEMG